MTCAECRFEAPADFAFCPRCGSKLKPSAPAAPVSPAGPSAVLGERRIVTILFADVAGFTAMSEQLDHEAVNQVMRACWAELDQEVIEHGGIVDKHIGDALMATFGAQVAHEDDPLRAVQVGLGLQRRLAAFSERLRAATGLSLRMRCGIAMGEVTVDRVADSTQELSVIGPAVNLASRLEHECDIGSVFVNEDVHRATEWAIDYRALEPRPIKGIDGLVPIYQALSERQASRRGLDRPPVALGVVGRQAEQAALRQAMDDVLAGEGRIVALIGEAGLGKSSLGAWLRQVAVGAGCRWVAGRCLSYSATHPYAAVREAMRDLLAVEGDTPAEHIADRLSAIVQEQAARADDLARDGERAALSLRERHALLLRLMLTEEVAAANSTAAGFVETLGSRIRHRLTVQAICELFVMQARRCPLILCLEDLHWCDAESLEVAKAIAGALPHERLLLLVQSRPDVEPEWLHAAHARVLRLQPLGAADATALVDAVLRERALVSGSTSSTAARGGGLAAMPAELAELNQTQGETRTPSR